MLVILMKGYGQPHLLDIIQDTTLIQIHKMSAKALSFTPSHHFDGNNGKWSSFIIRVGSPEQDFRVLPAPCTGAIFVPGPMGCEGSSGAPVDCADFRGVDPDHYLGFQSNVSQTWHAIEKGTTEIARNLGVNSTAYFGTDSVGLMVQNSGGPTMKDQVVGSLTDNRPFFVGFFGLSPKPFNFTNFMNPYPSYLTTLRDAGGIPSLSYGYTAGANYSMSHCLPRTYLTAIETPKVLSSLTLGGYDESRFEPGVVTFPFDMNDDQPTSVLLQDIRSDRPLNDTRSILPEVLYVQIDFTLPYLWLPNDTCDRIASIFNLEYNSERNLYLIGEDTHAENTRNNLNLSFDLGPSRNPSERVSIDLPYAAFDLQASWPMCNVTTRFFPMKRAIGSQYILGRAFMQEAYIIVD